MMIKRVLSLFGFLFLILSIHAQITIIPSKAKSTEDIEIIFDAGKGNKALFGLDGEVYFHAGLITGTSATTKDWKFVRGNWGKADANFKMEKLGGDKYKLIINPQEFFGLDSSIQVQQIALVFRDAKGEKVAKTKAETDFLIPLNGYVPKTKEIDSLKYTKRKFKAYFLNGQNLRLQTNHGTYNFQFYNSNIIKVVFYPEEEIENIPSPCVVLDPLNTKSEIFEDEKLIKWTNNDFSLLIYKEPLQIAYYYRGELSLKEELGFFEKKNSTGVRFQLAKDEAIYGTGERAIPMNRRGYKFDLYNRPDYNYGKNARNLNYTLPVMLSSKKYLLFIDNFQKGTIDIGETEEDIMEFGSIGGRQQYFIVAGDSYSDISSSFTELVGRQDLPPRWALGNLQSRMAYRSQKEVEGIVEEMIKKDFPLDAVILDFYWFGDSILGYLGNLKWYEKNWPNPKKMIRDFKEKGVKTILITEPFIIDSSYWFQHTDTANLLATHKNGDTYVLKEFYFGRAGLLDIFKPQTKDWFWEQYKKQIEIGVAGWWGDLGEPETHPSDMFHINGKAEQVHNIYAHEWAAMLYNKYQEFYPNTRLFHLNRSGATGTQRYSIFSWSGDVSRSWSGFQAQLPLMLNMSLCGLAYSSSDLGGFALGEKDEELYTRWLQMGVFNPVFRPHGSGIPSEPIFFSEETQNNVRQAIKLRYRLMPYIYNAAYENTISGKPIVKPLFYYHPKDENLKNYSDAYYFGDEIVAAPIIDKGAKEKDVYLPKGWWYDFYSTEIFQGEKNITMDVQMDRIPVFIKAGAFIPMVNNYQTTDRYPKDKLIIHYYPSFDKEETHYSLYEDDGIQAKNIINENYQIIHFFAQVENDIIMISSERESMNYQENQANRDFLWIIHQIESKPKEVLFNGKHIPILNLGDKQNINSIHARFNKSNHSLIIKAPMSQTINIRIIRNDE
jgi:alpha-glucosidase (family GH31 glycosyl hydrolase)